MALAPKQNPEEKIAGDLALKTSLIQTIETVFAAQAEKVAEARRDFRYFHPDVTLPLADAVSDLLPELARLRLFGSIAESLPDQTAEIYRARVFTGKLSPESLRLLTLTCNNQITPTTSQQRSKAIQVVAVPSQLPEGTKLEVGQRFYSVFDLAKALHVTPTAIYNAFRNAETTSLPGQPPVLPHSQGVSFQWVSKLEEEAN